jgi:uncharacterized DUF497 family protein
MNFHWNANKAEKNLAKHDVDFVEASTIFADPFALTIFDANHSSQEDRYVTIGFSDRGRLLIVWHTDRDDLTRIIGARHANKLETKAYNAGRS